MRNHMESVWFHILWFLISNCFFQICLVTCRCGPDSFAPSPQDGNGLTQQEVDAGLQVEELKAAKKTFQEEGITLQEANIAMENPHF